MTPLNKSSLQKIQSLKEFLGSQQSRIATPLYLYDPEEVRANLGFLKQSFRKEGVEVSIFYATKSNSYLGLLQTIVTEGEGIDVSSQRELRLALEAGAQKIIYTGPAKTEEDFALILEHHEKITVNLETYRELELLAEMATEKGVKVRCGLRITTSNQKGWTKFGQPLSELRYFYEESRKYESLHFCGIHFHISFNKTPEPYVETFRELSEYLKQHFSEAELAQIEYIDMGGGIVPQTYEGTYPWNTEQAIKFFSSHDIFSNIYHDAYQPRYHPMTTQPGEVFAQEISKAFQSYIQPILPNVSLYLEPGRFVSHSSMHLVFRLIDIKEDKETHYKIGITDGGTNMIGWEKYQFCNYAPLFNLSQLSTEREIPFITYGSLCTPDDIWGYYLYTAGEPQEGDILLLPFQGAYTHTLAQNFIKEVPPVVSFSEEGVGK